MRANLSGSSLRAAMRTIFRAAALCLLFGMIWALLGCGGAYRNNPMATTAPMSTPTSNPPMPMHRSHK